MSPTALTILRWEHRELWESPENTGFERSHMKWEKWEQSRRGSLDTVSAFSSPPPYVRNAPSSILLFEFLSIDVALSKLFDRAGGKNLPFKRCPVLG